MKILFKKRINARIMTGIISKDNTWFFGFSKVSVEDDE